MFRVIVGLMLVFCNLAYADSVPSVRQGMSVSISGFESVDPATHMIEWLGKGRNSRGFVVHDIETELYAQDQGAQVLSIRCVSTPEYETRAMREGNGTETAILSQFSVTFPLEVRVRASNGIVWRLDVKLRYLATGLDDPEKHRLHADFGVVGQQEE